MSTNKTTTPKKNAPKKEVPKIDNSPEAKAERFKTVISRRTLNVLRTLSNMGNCANKNVYAYTPEQVLTVFNTLKGKLSEVEKKFEAAAEKKKVEFKLD